MPRSKRARLVALTKTDKRSTRDHKTKYIEDVRKCVDDFDSLYVFSYENMRSNKFKDLRLKFRDNSRILLGKNKLLQLALGKSEEEEYQDGLQKVAKHISGSVGLIFTSSPREQVEAFFDSFSEPDFAKSGFVSPRDVMITNEMLKTQPVSMLEQQFQKQGLPIEIQNGVLVLRNDMEEYRLCREGETLSPEKCKALVHFDIRLSEFKVNLVCRWADGEFSTYD